MSGIGVETNPIVNETFIIPAGTESFGNLSLCEAGELTRCPPPAIEERRRVRITVSVSAAGNGEFLFGQIGEFVRDTEAPLIESGNVQLLSDNRLAVQVRATDQTTSPPQATFWSSTDNGKTWDSAVLPSTTNLSTPSATREFAAEIGPFPSGSRVMYLISVQDSLYNLALLGSGQVDVPVIPL